MKKASFYLMIFGLIFIIQINAQENVVTNGTNKGIKLEIGRFVLLKFYDYDMAMKLTEKTRKSDKDQSYLGAKYECFVFTNHDYKNYTKCLGEVFEPNNGGVENNIYIECKNFKIEWSRSNWIYFNDSIKAIALTDITNIKDINFDDNKYKWISP